MSPDAMIPILPPHTPYPHRLRSRALLGDPLLSRGPSAAWRWTTWPTAAHPRAFLLQGHTGCVNSIALSPTPARLLLTGSDDQCLRLWPVYDLHDHPDDDAPSPRSVATLTGARRNVFHALFFASAHRIVSSGADGMLRVHDLNHTSGPPSLTFAHEHGDIVQRLATLGAHVVMSACDDGSVRVWDARDARKSVGVLQLTVPVSHIEPLQDDPRGEFLCCGEGGLLAKFDFRTCFGGAMKRKHCGDDVDTDATTPTQRRRRKWRVLRDDGPEPVLEYSIDNNNIASLALSPDGQQFVVLPQYGLPHLYSTTHPHPLASFSHTTPPPDPTHPDAFHFSGYSNVATHKVPAFLPSGTHVLSGSDDFGIYAWRVPTCPDDTRGPGPPVHVPRADRVLFGHMSLPNRVLAHPDLPLLLSCGIEHSVRVSTFASGDSPVPAARQPRGLLSARVCMDAFRDVMLGADEDDTDAARAERRTVAYFDMVVRQAAAAQAKRAAARVDVDDWEGSSSGDNDEDLERSSDDEQEEDDEDEWD